MGSPITPNRPADPQNDCPSAVSHRSRQRVILVSACLVGARVRYDGRLFREVPPALVRWQAGDLLVPVCPEVAGGCPVPRPPAEISGGTGADVLAGEARVINNRGKDVTAAFLDGARCALALAREKGAVMAILKANSPSCGNRNIYNGTFSGAKRAGAGVAAALLERHGIRVFSEKDLEAAWRYWQDHGQD